MGDTCPDTCCISPSTATDAATNGAPPRSETPDRLRDSPPFPIRGPAPHPHPKLGASSTCRGCTCGHILRKVPTSLLGTSTPILARTSIVKRHLTCPGHGCCAALLEPSLPLFVGSPSSSSTSPGSQAKGNQSRRLHGFIPPLAAGLPAQPSPMILLSLWRTVVARTVPCCMRAIPIRSASLSIARDQGEGREAFVLQRPRRVLAPPLFRLSRALAMRRVPCPAHPWLGSGCQSRRPWVCAGQTGRSPLDEKSHRITWQAFASHRQSSLPRCPPDSGQE
ncbi:hypothetical protein CDD83_1888 [Cordyceps sp. RAO-2017]|nr:hypothetical protein CDD83_1888 [Cordyceps sp. RAO-2017]